MKTTHTAKLRLLVIALLFFSINIIAQANEATRMTIIDAGYGKRLALTIEGLAADASLQIKDLKGIILMQEKITENSYRKLINLQALPVGQYVVSLATDTREIVQPFELTERSVVVRKTLRQETYSPIVKVVDEHLMDFSFLNKLDGTVTISIRNETGLEVFKENFIDQMKIERRYNLEKLSAGDYLVQVSSPQRSWQYNITIK